MVRAYAFPFWPWNFSAGVAHRALSDAWRHFDRRAFLHGSRAHRTKVRYRPGALARDVSGLSSTPRAGIFSLLYLAPFQTHAEKRDPRARTFAGRRQTGSWLASPSFLEL